MEYFDLYDANRVPLGKTIARGEKLKEKEHRLTVHVCIFNSQDKMLIQQRQSFKKGWPNAWDISVGGCVVAGESTQKAGEREVKEEFGIDINLQGTRPFFTINFENGFDDFYFVKKDIDIIELTLQEEEVQDAKWASKEEVKSLLTRGEFIPYYESFIDALFEMRAKRGIHR